MKYFGFAASLRKDSVNQQLIQLVERLLIEAKIDFDLFLFSKYDAPLYNYDIETSSGLPQGIQTFISDLKQHHGLILSSPEYNFATPGTLKNFIDWTSRDTNNPLSRYPILLMSASPSLVGGHRGLWQTRIPLEGLGAHVFPEMFCLATAHQAFDDQGNLKDTKQQERLRNTVLEFIEFTRKLKQ